jgi:phosphoribosylamine--glycine ligase
LFLAANEKLDEITLEIDERSATTVMLYRLPEDFEKEKLFLIENITDSIVFMQEQKLDDNEAEVEEGY